MSVMTKHEFKALIKEQGLNLITLGDKLKEQTGYNDVYAYSTLKKFSSGEASVPALLSYIIRSGNLQEKPKKYK